MINKRVSIGIAGAGRVAQVLGRLLAKASAGRAIAGRNPERTAAAARFIGHTQRPRLLKGCLLLLRAF